MKTKLLLLAAIAVAVGFPNIGTVVEHRANSRTGEGAEAS